MIYPYGPLHMAEQKQGDKLKPTYSSSVRIRGVALRTCRMWWTIGRCGERGSGIFVLVARQDDDDEYRYTIIKPCLELGFFCFSLAIRPYWVSLLLTGRVIFIVRTELLKFVAGGSTHVYLFQQSMGKRHLRFRPYIQQCPAYLANLTMVCR